MVSLRTDIPQSQSGAGVKSFNVAILFLFSQSLHLAFLLSKVLDLLLEIVNCLIGCILICRTHKLVSTKIAVSLTSLDLDMESIDCFSFCLEWVIFKFPQLMIITHKEISVSILFLSWFQIWRCKSLFLVGSRSMAVWMEKAMLTNLWVATHIKLKSGKIFLVPN